MSDAEGLHKNVSQTMQTIQLLPIDFNVVINLTSEIVENAKHLNRSIEGINDPNRINPNMSTVQVYGQAIATRLKQVHLWMIKYPLISFEDLNLDLKMFVEKKEFLNYQMARENLTDSFSKIVNNTIIMANSISTDIMSLNKKIEIINNSINGFEELLILSNPIINVFLCIPKFVI